MRLFQPVGRQLFETWCAQWQEAFDAELQPSTELAIVQRLIEANTVVRVTIAFAGAVVGRVQVYVRPEVLVPKPAVLAAIKAKALSVANALSYVPVELVVELGTLRLPLGKIRSLERGATHPLPKFVDSRVPVYCGGVLKAWAGPSCVVACSRSRSSPSCTVKEPSHERFYRRKLRPCGARVAAPRRAARRHDRAGRTRLNISELAARLGPGSIITLDKPTGAPLDVRVNSRLIARAEAIAIGERTGIRIVELVGGKDS